MQDNLKGAQYLPQTFTGRNTKAAGTHEKGTYSQAENENGKKWKAALKLTVKMGNVSRHMQKESQAGDQWTKI